MSRDNPYLISDPHLGHERMAEFRGFSSVEEHDQTIIENWNETVAPNDHVWCLGDFIWSNTKTPPHLNGNITLVLGNHDFHHKMYSRMNLKVRSMREKGKWVFTHVPLHPQCMDRWKVNVHGHIHSDLVLKNGAPDSRYICVSCEHIGYRPVQLLDLQLGGLASKASQFVAHPPKVRQTNP